MQAEYLFMWMFLESLEITKMIQIFKNNKISFNKFGQQFQEKKTCNTLNETFLFSLLKAKWDKV